MSYFVRRYGRTMPIPSQTGAEARAVPAASGGRGRKPGIPEPVRPASRTLASPERLQPFAATVRITRMPGRTLQSPDSPGMPARPVTRLARMPAPLHPPYAS